MSIMDQIDPPWQTANIFVLFNAFETLCFPQCITDMARIYCSSVNVKKSCILLLGVGVDELLRACAGIFLKYLLLDIKCAFCRILNLHIGVFL